MHGCNCGSHALFYVLSWWRIAVVNLLEKLKVCPGLAAILMEDQPPLALSLAAHTHSKTHAQVHMPVSCLRLYSKSDSLLPAFPSQPYCFVSRCSIGARSHKRKDSTSNLHPRRFSCSTWLFWRTLKKNCLKHMQREIWLTRNQFILLSVEWTKGPVASRIRWLQLSQPQKSEEKSSQSSVFRRIFLLSLCLF